MTEKLKKYLPVVLAVLICALFGMVLLAYTTPMENASYDLSLIGQDGPHISTPDHYDEKGWSVYTCEDGQRTLLTATGSGSYTGIALGQTFYFSRVMSEDLDSPILQIGTGERQFVVFLDDEVIYSDCPQLDQRIGFLRIPESTVMRKEPITITLPQNYHGRTLTIAQSMPEYSETPTIRAYPASVRLYCCYAYESELIAESFSKALLADALFAVGVVLLCFFARNGKPEILCIALSAFLWMSILLIQTSFFSKYFGILMHDLAGFCQFGAVLALLVFLVCKAVSHRRLLWVLLGLYTVSLAVYLVLDFIGYRSIGWLAQFLQGPLTEWIAVGAFLVILALGIFCWRQESRFYRFFAPLSLLGLGLFWAWTILSDPSEFHIQLTASLYSLRISYFYVPTVPVISCAALLVAIAEEVQNAMLQRTEKRLMEQRQELALASYENLRHQHEEVMMLRHDMVRHFYTLRDIGSEDKRTAYLSELIGQNEKIRPVIESGNEMLDIILNGRLSHAIDAGIRVELPHVSAPAVLPLSDPDLCALIMNIVDNAIAAAAGSDAPYILLKTHEREGFFGIVCENSMNRTEPDTRTKKGTVPKHGLGLKIVRNIVSRYSGVLTEQKTDGRFIVKIVLPL